MTYKFTLNKIKLTNFTLFYLDNLIFLSIYISINNENNMNLLINKKLQAFMANNIT